MQFKFSLIKKVPMVEMDGKACLLDTGFPGETMPVCAGVQEFFGNGAASTSSMQNFRDFAKIL